MTKEGYMELAEQHKGKLAAFLVLLSSFLFLYYSVIGPLIRDWVDDGNYSHGFFILPISLYFVWKNRRRYRSAKLEPSLLGLIMVLGSLAVLFAGVLGADIFMTRITLIGVIAGAVLYVYGWQHLKLAIYPILFLILMIPLPAIIFNQIAFPLQIIASKFSEIVLYMVGIPALREGNIIQLPNISLEVVEACSGIRSLLSMLTLSIVYGYFADNRIWIRILLAMSTVPIAILTNGVRVALTGIAAHRFGAEAAQGFIHGFSGWLIFLLAFLMLFLLLRLIHCFFPSSNRSA
jgi:exosortase